MRKVNWEWGETAGWVSWKLKWMAASLYITTLNHYTSHHTIMYYTIPPVTIPAHRNAYRHCVEHGEATLKSAENQEIILEKRTRYCSLSTVPAVGHVSRLNNVAGKIKWILARSPRYKPTGWGSNHHNDWIEPLRSSRINTLRQVNRLGLDWDIIVSIPHRPFSTYILYVQSITNVFHIILRIRWQHIISQISY